MKRLCVMALLCFSACTAAPAPPTLSGDDYSHTMVAIFATTVYNAQFTATAQFMLTQPPALTNSPTITSTLSDTPHPVPTRTPRPTATLQPIQPTYTPAATYTLLPTLTPYPTERPAPTAVPRPTSTPRPVIARGPINLYDPRRAGQVVDGLMTINMLPLFCHDAYNFNEFTASGVVAIMIDPDGSKELDCRLKHGQVRTPYTTNSKEPSKS